MKKLLLLSGLLAVMSSCTNEDLNNSECDEINAFYNQQQAQVLKQANPDQRQLKNIEEERQLKLKKSGCN